MLQSRESYFSHENLVNFMQNSSVWHAQTFPNSHSALGHIALKLVASKNLSKPLRLLFVQLNM